MFPLPLPLLPLSLPPQGRHEEKGGKERQILFAGKRKEEFLYNATENTKPKQKKRHVAIPCL